MAARPGVTISRQCANMTKYKLHARNICHLPQHHPLRCHSNRTWFWCGECKSKNRNIFRPSICIGLRCVVERIMCPSRSLIKSRLGAAAMVIEDKVGAGAQCTVVEIPKALAAKGLIWCKELRGDLFQLCSVYGGLDWCCKHSLVMECFEHQRP